MNQETLVKQLRIAGSMVMLVGALFEITPLIQDLTKEHSPASLDVWSIIITVIAIAAMIVVWGDYAIAGGILGIIVGAWIIVLEGGAFGLSLATSILFFIAGAISILAGVLKIVLQPKSNRLGQSAS